MSYELYAFFALALLSLGTLITRNLPPVLFSMVKVPAFLEWLSAKIAPCIIAMLLVYCFKDSSLKSAPLEILGVCAVVATYFVFYRFQSRGLIAIFVGSAVYIAALNFSIF